MGVKGCNGRLIYSMYRQNLRGEYSGQFFPLHGAQYGTSTVMIIPSSLMQHFSGTDSQLLAPQLHYKRHLAGLQEFCEECPGESRLVTRDPALQDNAALPAAFQRKAGDLLYTGLRDGLVVDGKVSTSRLCQSRHLAD